MNILKTFLTICLSGTMLQSPAATMEYESTSDNPLLQPSTLPFGAPDFSKIKSSDYLPAFKAAIQQKRDDINRIVSEKKKPTFENTIVAYEQSGLPLDRVTSIF